MTHIAILVYRDDGPLNDAHYLIRVIAEAWIEKGFDVSVLLGPQPSVEADVAILHVNLTVVPEEYLEFIRRYPVVINGGVADISKRAISRHVVRLGDGYDGPVIVKTDRNHGGKREGRILARGTPIERHVHGLRALLPWWWQAEIPTGDYPVFDHVGLIPYPVWSNPELVVEKFLPERADEFYVVRTWLFFGDREMNSVGYARCPVIKAGDIVRRDDTQPVPDDLREIRRELGFDYGKFDYGIVDGRAILYDANRTPTLGARPIEEYMARGRVFAEGIRAYLS
jgi:hypothetical protein